MKIGVGGCVASQEGAEIILGCAPLCGRGVGPQTLVHRLPEMLNQREQLDKPQVDISFPRLKKFDHLPPARVEGASALCRSWKAAANTAATAWCLHPGEEVSRPFDDVLVEVAGLADQGVKEITLLGQNVNAYLGEMGGTARLPTLRCC